jgi:cytochrome b561
MPAMPAWQRVLARSTHAIFYVLLFALPVTGWMISSAEGDPIRIFGLFELLPIGAVTNEDTLEDLHETLFNVLLAFAALHVLGALKHHFWDRDHVLRSMLPAELRSRQKYAGRATSAS